MAVGTAEGAARPGTQRAVPDTHGTPAERCRRDDWLAASGSVTAALRSGDLHGAVSEAARGARAVAGAAVAWVELLTQSGGALVATADGAGADQLDGAALGPDAATLLHRVVTTQATCLTDAADVVGGALARLALGPLAAVPLVAGGQCTGALLIGRAPDAWRFSGDEIRAVTPFADQAALAVELARGEAHRRRAACAEDAARAAYDLHDAVIQQLFAIGLQLDGMAPRLPGAEQSQLARIGTDVFATIGELRTGLVEARRPRSARLRSECCG
jgi:signal transduction histidine kinase